MAGLDPAIRSGTSQRQIAEAVPAVTSLNRFAAWLQIVISNTYNPPANRSTA
jgi:hypothetical protein